jgi:hypothetical protein
MTRREKSVSSRDFTRRNQSRAAVILDVMAKSDETHELSWPWWAPWALLAVALTSLLTVGATLYDIL